MSFDPVLAAASDRSTAIIEASAARFSVSVGFVWLPQART
jgi:hypothetical protein